MRRHGRSFRERVNRWFTIDEFEMRVRRLRARKDNGRAMRRFLSSYINRPYPTLRAKELLQEITSP